MINLIMISIMDIPKKMQHDHAHKLLRECLKSRDIAYSEDLRIEKGKYGKPYLAEYPDVKYNISHADGIAACMVSDSECGIDCEKVRNLREGVLRRAFSEREREMIASVAEAERDLLFFRLWTLKESYIKAIGTGLSYPLETAEFLLNSGEIHTNIKGWHFRQHILRDNKYVVSICEKLNL